MILFDRGVQRLRYTIRPAGDGWCVYEGEQAITYTDSQVYAKAIAQALNLQQLLATMGVHVPQPPAQPELN